MKSCLQTQRHRETKRMNLSELKLPELLTVDEAAGTIHFRHRRMLLFDADAMGLLRKELTKTLGLERTRRLLTRFGYACGYRDALTSKELFAWNSVEDWWAAGPRLHTLEGIVRVRPLHFQIDTGRGVFATESEWINSYEAEQHLKHIGSQHCTGMLDPDRICERACDRDLRQPCLLRGKGMRGERRCALPRRWQSSH